MRIVAGVLLLVAAIFNGCAGSAYTLGGAVAGVGGAALEEIGKGSPTTAAGTVDPEAAKLRQDAGKAKAVGGGLMLFGIFLFVMLALDIAGAVVLFMGKAARFAIGVGVLGVIAEVAGMLITGGFKWTNVFGVVGSILCVIAAAKYRSSSASASRPRAASLAA
jgi:hypothetical protein